MTGMLKKSLKTSSEKIPSSDSSFPDFYLMGPNSELIGCNEVPTVSSDALALAKSLVNSVPFYIFESISKKSNNDSKTDLISSIEYIQSSLQTTEKTHLERTRFEIVKRQNGKRCFVALKKIEKDFFNDWFVVVSYPEEFLIQRFKKQENFFVVVICVMILFLILSFLWIIRTVSMPLRILSQKADLLRLMKLDKTPPFSSSVSEFVQLNHLLDNTRNNLKNFEKFIPRMVIERINTTKSDVRIGGQVRPLTFFFSDIENFTHISETYPPDRVFQHLSEYLE
jgi:hypothetical protein